MESFDTSGPESPPSLENRAEGTAVSLGKASLSDPATFEDDDPRLYDERRREQFYQRMRRKLRLRAEMSLDHIT